jgi:hypothetical protein
LAGPGDDAVGNPPVAPYCTSVKLAPFVSIHPDTGTTLPSVLPVPRSAPGFFNRFGVVAAKAGDANSAGPARSAHVANAATSDTGFEQRCLDTIDSSSRSIDPSHSTRA